MLLICKQNVGESFDSFYTELVKKNLTCGFRTIRENLVLLICGLNAENQHGKERLLRETDLNLQKAVTICKAAEYFQYK